MVSVTGYLCECYRSWKLLIVALMGLVLGTSMYSFYQGFGASYLDLSQTSRVSCTEDCGNYSENSLVDASTCAVIDESYLNSTSTAVAKDEFGMFKVIGNLILAYAMAAVIPIAGHDIWLYHRVKISKCFQPFTAREERMRVWMFKVVTFIVLLIAAATIVLCEQVLVRGLGRSIPAVEFLIEPATRHQPSSVPSMALG